MRPKKIYLLNSLNPFRPGTSLSVALLNIWDGMSIDEYLQAVDGNLTVEGALNCLIILISIRAVEVR